MSLLVPACAQCTRSLEPVLGKLVELVEWAGMPTQRQMHHGAAQKISCIVYVLRPTGALVPASPCTTSRFHTARAALTCTHAEVFTLAVILLRIGRTVP